MSLSAGNLVETSSNKFLIAPEATVTFPMPGQNVGDVVPAVYIDLT